MTSGPLDRTGTQDARTPLISEEPTNRGPIAAVTPEEVHHGAMIDRERPWIRLLFKAPVRLYRWHLGWLLGHRFLLLQHSGRRSGRRYETVLEVVRWDPDREVMVVSGWGPSADWYRNVTAGGDVRISSGQQNFAATHRVVPAEEAAQVLADYERRNRWVRPVINRMLGFLVGWRYDGSAEARRRLVEQLPMVAFQLRRTQISVP